MGEICCKVWPFFVARPFYRKGIGLTFPNQDVDAKWQHKRSWGRLRGPRREFSFLVNECTDPGIGLTGEGVGGSEKAVGFGPLRCALDAP
jgi:hypothetical protein